MTAVTPEPRVLRGSHVELSPLTPEDLPALYPVLATPEIFAGGYGGGPAGLPADFAAFEEFAGRYFQTERNRVFVVRLIDGPDAGTVVGTTTLGDFEPAREACHLGWTAYDRRVWGTVVNAECKLLLLGYAFEHGFGRVKIQADERNTRSRAAIAKIGATFEGLLRRDQLRADGSWRTTALFAVIVDDWPEVAAGLRERIAAATEPVRLRERDA